MPIVAMPDGRAIMDDATTDRLLAIRHLGYVNLVVERLRRCCREASCLTALALVREATTLPLWSAEESTNRTR